ncbi:MAG: HD domain-containing protein [Patescibacteria group bacterium]|nr:HD domain-containing protein [Patescibacteria group bacterium]
MDIVTKVKIYVEEECKKPTSHYGYEPFVYHFPFVAKYSLELADKLGGDREVLAIASWLHDIGAIVSGRENHHTTGAKIAEEKLTEFGYPKEKIELVKKCILNHRGSQNNNRISVEEQIIGDADALSNFDNISGIFKAAFVYESLDQEKAQKSVREKLKRKWDKLHFEESKKIIRPKYEAIMLLLK